MRRPFALGLERWVLALGVGSVILMHAPLIGYKAYANVDEAYASALGSRLLDGHKLYEGAISQRGPLMYYVFEAFAWVHGWDNILALRLWALALSLLHIALVYVVARSLLSREAAVVASAVSCYGLAFGFPPEDGVAINGEVLQLPALMGAVLLQGRAMMSPAGTRDRRLRLLASGILLGASIAIKQGAIIQMLPIMVWLAADVRRHRKIGIAMADGFAVLAGTAIVPLAFVLPAVANGTLRAMYYYTVVYNRDVHMQPAPSFPHPWLPPFFLRLLLLTGFFAVTVVLAGTAWPWIAGRIRTARRTPSGAALLRGFGARHFIALHFALGTLAATAMYRFFPHYFIQAFPFLALSVGAVFERAVRTSARARSALGAFMSFCVGATCAGFYFGEKVDGRVAHDDTVDSMSRIITATTKPTDRIFVWGFSSWLYGYSHRRPAGRYVFSTYVTGFVPWFPESLTLEASRIVPGSVEALLSDLEKEQPAIIVDAGSIMMLRPMRAYPQFSQYLHEHYCFEVRLGAMDLYRRHDAGFACPVPFPRVAPGVDYLGHLIPGLQPKLVDAATNKPLPDGNFYKPIYFLDGPVPPGIDAARTKRRDKDEADAKSRGFCVPELGKPDCTD